MKLRSLTRLCASIFVAEFIGYLGSFYTTASLSNWYQFLVRPSFAPPNWIFGIVWTILFLLMGIAAFLVWEKGLKRREIRVALEIYIIQLVLNLTWSVLFFGAQNITGAFIEIISLWIAILATVIVFFRISRVAGWLLIPYILWVTFAVFLNYSFMVFN